MRPDGVGPAGRIRPARAMTRLAVGVRLVVLLVSASVVSYGILVVVADRDAGWPHDSRDLEGRWVLDHTTGDGDAVAPAELVISPGSDARSIRISDGRQTAEFEIDGLGRLVAAEGARFEPLLAAGSSEVFTMTHVCPAVLAWDHLTFFPDGRPAGPDEAGRRLTYERE